MLALYLLKFTVLFVVTKHSVTALGRSDPYLMRDDFDVSITTESEGRKSVLWVKVNEEASCAELYRAAQAEGINQVLTFRENDIPNNYLPILLLGIKNCSNVEVLLMVPGFNVSVLKCIRA